MVRPAFANFAQHYFAAILQNFGTVYLNEPIPRDPKLRIYKHPARSNFGTTLLGKLTTMDKRILISPEVEGEADLVDVLFEPNAQISRQSLGVLGELLFTPSIIAALRWTPNHWMHQTHLMHLLRWQSEVSESIIPANEETSTLGEGNTNHDIESEPMEKRLLMIVPSITPKHLNHFGFSPSQKCISGIYSSLPAFCTTIVVVNQLPQEESTLWVRLLGRRSTQQSAIDELLQLNVSHPLRSIAIEQLRLWYQLLRAGKIGRESSQLIESLSKVNS
jgi:hypothetical protein